MVTDEEILKETRKLFDFWNSGNAGVGYYIEKAIKKGIQMERERLRKIIKKRGVTGTHVNGDKVKYYTILVNDIDIWDD